MAVKRIDSGFTEPTEGVYLFRCNQRAEREDK
ncbi:hypothetical protein Pan97_10860 [Bremerella volcania]|uniref:Uncharacterized protein n=1 Tax=Bremerella volcania TaxID=2527984 RepID=A0A518C4C5_9BACT|nr:hypothetical protein Pan97_10860 [Bremerella volcania]